MLNTVEEACRRCFSGLAQSADPALNRIFSTARLLQLPAGATVFHVGAACEQYLLVVEGQVKVFLLAPSGREVTLYSVRPGQSCVLTTSCLLGQARYPAGAVTETAVTTIAISLALFQQTLDQSAAFRRFVFASLGDRLAAVISRMEEVTFGEIDQRLAALLLARGTVSGKSEQNTLHATHQELALELGTAREVVSRHLKQFELRGWVRLGRSSVELLNPSALQRLARV